jgi:hypothetical protein
VKKNKKKIGPLRVGSCSAVGGWHRPDDGSRCKRFTSTTPFTGQQPHPALGFIHCHYTSLPSIEGKHICLVHVKASAALIRAKFSLPSLLCRTRTSLSPRLGRLALYLIPVDCQEISLACARQGIGCVDKGKALTSIAPVPNQNLTEPSACSRSST